MNRTVSGNLKIHYGNGSSIIISQEEENWGSARPLQTFNITVSNIEELITALKDVQSNMRYNESW